MLKSSPSRVVLVFDEGVATSAGALGVYDGAGKHVDSGDVLRPAGDSVAVDIPTRLPDGTYTIAWRVTSADTHVVHGAFTFSVGHASAAGGIAAKLEAGAQIPRSVTVPFAAVRFLNFILILACAGGALTLAVALGGAAPAVRRRIARLTAACATLLVPLAAVGLVFEAAEAQGGGLGRGFGAAALEQVRSLRFGEVWLARAWIAVAIAVLALLAEHRPGRLRRVNEAATLLLGVALVLTTTAAGHGGVNGWFAFLVDAVHVAAAAAWTGGLLFLVVAVVSTAASERWAFAARAVPRFSALALGSVALLLAAGVVNAYLEVRVWRGLWQTTYGVLVLVKAALVLPLLALGAFNNRVSVPRLRASIASAVEQRRFLRAVAAELAVLVAVVAVTAVLVDEAPAKDSLPQPKSATVTATIGPYSGKVVVAPAAVGANRITLRLEDRSGRPAELAEVDVAASLPARGIGPLRLTTRRTAPGTYTASGAAFAIAGSWRLQLTVRKDAFDEWLQTVPITIRKGLTQ